MGSEAKVALGTGQNLRNIKVQTLVDGVLTDVLMEVVSLSDANGNIISDFADYNFQTQVIRRLNAIANQLMVITNQHVPIDSLLEGEL
jgi:phosphatidate phosphatase APP1